MLFHDITAVVGEDYRVCPHQYVEVRGAAISYIGDTPPAGGGEGDEVYDGRGKVLLPGFYNAHCHVPMTLLRGYGEGLPLERWLNERMFPFEALLTGEDMYWGALLGIAELVGSGAVSISDMYMGMQGIVRAVEESGFKANLCQSVTAFGEPRPFRETEGYAGLQFLQGYVGAATNGRIRADACIHGEYTSHEALVREVAQYAAGEGLRAHIHLSETRQEHEGCKRRHGKTPAQYFSACGMFEVPCTAAHCVWVEEADIGLLAEKGVTVAHCPSSNLKLGSGIAPVAALLAAGVRVGVGTDGAASNNNLNMLEEVNLASLLQKGATGDATALGPRELLRMACLNGAAAQGRAGCGCIGEGCRADLVVYDLQRPHLQPVYDVLSNLLYSAQGADVALTMIDGRVVYRDGNFPTIDLERVLFEVGRIKEEKLERLGA